MPILQRLIGYGGLALMLGTLVGIFVRRHDRVARAFPAYLLVLFATDVLMTTWPQRFYTRDFWLAKEVLVAALRFAIALELAYRTFSGFPGAAVVLRRALLLGLAATYAAVLALPAPSASYPTAVAELQPRVANGTVWLLTAISGLVLWYRLPLAPFNKAILIGLAPYLLLSTVARNILATSAELRPLAGYLETAAWAAVSVYWCRAAWRSSGEPARPPTLRLAGTRTLSANPGRF